MVVLTAFHNILMKCGESVAMTVPRLNKAPIAYAIAGIIDDSDTHFRFDHRKYYDMVDSLL